LNPIEGIQIAVTRSALNGNVIKNNRSWNYEEKITIQEALDLHTHKSCVLNGKGTEVGMLKAGMNADFVILSSDPLSYADDSSNERIYDLHRSCLVLETYVQGSLKWKKT